VTKPLFINPETAPSFADWEKLAGYRLPSDARLWQQEITRHISAQHPYLPVDEMVIEFRRIDPIKGAAVGTAQFQTTGVALPLIIKRARSGADPELAPVDVFFNEGEYHPLIPENIGPAMLRPDLGEPVRPENIGGPRSTAGGNPYVGDLTGDASPLEYSGQASPFSGPFDAYATKVSEELGLDAVKLATAAGRALKRMNPTAAGAIIGTFAGAASKIPDEVGKQIEHAHEVTKGMSDEEKKKVRNHAIARGVVSGGVRGAVSGAAQGAVVGHLTHAKRAGYVETLVKTGGMHPNDISNFRMMVAENPQVLQGASNNLHLVELILRHKGTSAPPKPIQNRPNVMQVWRDDLSGQLYIKFSGGPEQAVDESDLKSMLRDRYREAMEKVKQLGSFVIAEDIVQVTWSADRAVAQAKPVNSDGLWAVRTRQGQTVVGNVVLQVVRPSDGRRVPVKYLVTPEGEYATVAEMFGIKVSGRNKLPAKLPENGETGCFVSYLNGSPMASTPVTIKSIGRIVSGKGNGDMSKDFTVYNVVDPVTGDQMALIPYQGVQDFVKVKEIEPTKMSLTVGDVFYMPQDVMWTKLTGKVDIADGAEELKKLSTADYVGSRTHVVYNGSGFDVVHDFWKEADSAKERAARAAMVWKDVSSAECRELLIGMGMDHDGVVDAMKTAKAQREGGVKIAGLHEPQLRGHEIIHEKKASKPVTEALIASCRPSVSLIKAAARTGDESSLDAMLGLQFITPQNVRMFTENIDDLDQLSGKLASLLLATRLGLEHVEEDSVKEAMDGLAHTVGQLRLLQSASDYAKRQRAQ
jgi:hypothetical protein